MGFCTDRRARALPGQAPAFERMLSEDGIILLKYWFSVSDEEQEKRFRARLEDPLKQWKLSPMDVEAQAPLGRLLAAKDEMFEYTDLPDSPWNVVESDNKRNARSTASRTCCSPCPTARPRARDRAARAAVRRGLRTAAARDEPLRPRLRRRATAKELPESTSRAPAGAPPPDRVRGDGTEGRHSPATGPPRSAPPDQGAEGPRRDHAVAKRPRPGGRPRRGRRRADLGGVESLYRSGVHPAIRLCVRREGGSCSIARSAGPGVGPDDARREEGPVTPGHAVRDLLSASKAITACVAHLLDQRGRDPHRRPRSRSTSPSTARHGKERSRSRHVLSHRAGVPNLPGEALDLDPSTTGGVVEILCDAKPHPGPGARSPTTRSPAASSSASRPPRHRQGDPRRPRRARSSTRSASAGPTTASRRADLARSRRATHRRRPCCRRLDPLQAGAGRGRRRSAVSNDPLPDRHRSRRPTS